MFSPSDYNDAVPQFTNGNYANTPLNPLYIEEPGAVDYNRGMEPIQTLPAQWWNWLCNQFTAKLNKLNIYVKNIFDELTQLLSLVGVTPDATEESITTGQLKDAFQTKYPLTLTDKIPLSKGFLSIIFSRILGRYYKKCNINYSSSLNSVVYWKNLYLCCTGSTSGSGAFWSEDGINWTQGTSEEEHFATTGLREFKYTDNIIVALGGYYCYWSEDGKTWTQATGSLPTSLSLLHLANGMFFIGASSHTYWSEDGKTWTMCENVANSNCIIYENNIWVSTTNSGCFWSEDGKNWAQGTGSPSAPTNFLLYNDGLFVFGTNSTSSGQGCWWSEDGKTWTQGTGNTTTTIYGGIAYGNGVWVCGTYNDCLYYSENGKAWTKVTTVPNNGYKPVYANGLWNIPIRNNRLYWSEDGKTWTQGNISENINDNGAVGYINGIWYARQNYMAFISEDGKNWSKAIKYNNSIALYYIGFVKDRWFVGKLGGQNVDNGLWYSSIDVLLENGWLDLGTLPIANN